MIPFEALAMLPLEGESLADRVRATLVELESRLGPTGRGPKDLLSLSFFVDATSAADYETAREAVLARVREHLGEDTPPVSVVAQAPERGAGVALEASALAPGLAGVSLVRRTRAGVAYTLVSGGGVRQIHAGGIGAADRAGGVAAQAKEAFGAMEAILRAEAMDFGHVVRQWNYVEDILRVREDGGASHQGYQAFNDVRTLAYAGSEFPAGFPASTGIGQSAGGILLAFIALDAPEGVKVLPLSNPKQTDAHHYSTRMLVGESIEGLEAKSTPKFERAKLVARRDEERIFVSGTAAILGERSVAPGDVAAQTRTTIDNIAALIGDRRLTRLRAYVKRAEEIPEVRRICEAAFGTIPALYLRADVCRDELLVELEGELVRRASRD